MNEVEFRKVAKRYLEEQGYKIARLRRMGGAKKRSIEAGYSIDDDEGYLRVGVDWTDSVPDIVAVKDGKPYVFEVKSKFWRRGEMLYNTVWDRCIGQCLRYLVRFPWADPIMVVVPKGAKGLQQFRQFFKAAVAKLKKPGSLCLMEIPQKDVLRIKRRMKKEG